MSLRLWKTLKNARFFCTTAPPQPDYRLIYKYPHIKALSMIGRTKLYCTALAALITPTTYVLNVAKVCPPEVFQITAQLGITALLPLYLVGHFTNKFVGILYVNEQGDSVKLAHLDFWGHRNDLVIPLNDVRPIIDTKSTVNRLFYSKLERYSSKEWYRINVEDGVVDVEAFNKVITP